MRMIPSVCSGATRSNAERRVFDLLDGAVPAGFEDAVAFHSLNLSRHDYKRVAELDFVIASSTSLLVLEVKGGRIERTDGVWIYTDRYGEEHRSSEGPFNQASSGMFSLLGRLRHELGPMIDGLAVGFGVVFPNIDFDEESVEWDDAMVLDASAVRSVESFTRALGELNAYWLAKARRPEALTPGGFARVHRSLRPDFERIPSLRNRVDEIDAAMERLTGEQYERLDVIERADRIVCDGGAGTGKTFVAVEIARREASQGGRVVFMTSQPLQRSFVSSRLAASRVTVMTPEDGAPECDVLIVDEGQDLINVDRLLQFDSMLAGGLEHGRWRMFLDRNRQSGLIGRFDAWSLDYLMSDCHAYAAELTRNCRNTRPIAIETRMMTGADLGKSMAGEGPPVVDYYYDSETDLVEGLDAELNRLSDEGVRPGDITILSTKPLTSSAARSCRPARSQRLIDLSSVSDLDWPASRTTFAPIADFKGLENRFVLVVDVDSLTGADLNGLYVAMSRARAGLWIAYHSSLRSRVKQLSEQHLPLVIEDIRHD